ncbi:MAG: asparagine synthase (glutamine-hydrolyzing) [Gammaproteobacteria bacterium]|jgi:asparagine synthase (glutamine-hydrolysing)
MCGIAATWGELPPKLAKEMAARIAHRGLDGSGDTAIPELNVSMAHRRLSIMDPNGGRQPIRSQDNAAVLVANGMIYNDLALRETFGDSKFTTHSDSESILETCRQRGAAGVPDLDGMFAFVMVHGEKLIAARDPIGIKPLYIGLRDGGYCFASEIKALTPYVDEIREFPPGHVFDSSRGMSQYYTLPEATDDIVEASEAIQIIQQTLTKAVEKRLRSDVPLGVFLSGGLDSSIIAAIASRSCPGLKSFSVGLANSPDLKAARRVAEHLGTDHHEHILTPEEIQRDLPEILYHLESFDQDLVRSAVPCYYVSRLAAQHVKVVLTGEGADELFAGYDYHKEYEHPSALQAELRRSILTMHNINLQRVDRMTMAHGLEARVPFLDRAMLDIAFRIAIELKLPADSRIEKWVLRKAFEHLLPDDIVWRKKSQFDQGTGVADLLGRGETPHRQIIDERSPASYARSKEETAYIGSLTDRFEDPQAMLELVAHWDDAARVEDRPVVKISTVTPLHAESNRPSEKPEQPNDDFSAIYDLESSRPYFRRMKHLDYQIPASSNLVYRWCIDEIRRIHGKSELTVLDLCAGYGINGALMKCGCSFDEIYNYLTSKRTDAVCDPFFDRLSLLTQDTDHDLKVVGLDVAANALAYGRAAGFMDDVCAVDLEAQPMPSHIKAAIGECSLITITGGFSFIGTKTFEKILDVIDNAGTNKPWIAGFPLLHTNLSELFALLISRGYVIQPVLKHRLRQRRFANSTERRREQEALERADLKSSDDGYFESHLLLAQPPGMPALPDEVLQDRCRLSLIS